MLREDLAQREESINGEVAAAQARMKEQINSDMRCLESHASAPRPYAEEDLQRGMGASLLRALIISCL